MWGQMNVAMVFVRYGPYHIARLKGAIAAGQEMGWGVHGIEVRHSDPDYGWKPVEFDKELPVTTVAPREGAGPTLAIVRRRLFHALDELNPDCVAVPGYGDGLALTALAWCRINGRVAVLMSESKRNDAPRWLPLEAVKRILIGLYDAALVGGRAQEEYVVSLGMARERVFLGYDAVDNEHFERQSDDARSDERGWRDKIGVQNRFILSSSRFLRRKNIPRLLEAYAAYRSAVGPEQAWDLVVLGDGQDKARILTVVGDLSLRDCVRLPGFRQVDELPGWYGLASLFLHVPLRDQWGLVVNEAMASALPVIVSSYAGASELVRDGVDGWVVSPRDTDGIARLLVRAHKAGARELRSIGLSAREVVRCWGPRRFGQGLVAATEVGLRQAEGRDAASRLAGRILAFVLSVSTKVRREASKVDLTPDREPHGRAVSEFFTTAIADYSALFLAKRSGKNFEFRRRLMVAKELSATVSGSLLDCAVGTGEVTAAVLGTGCFSHAVCLDISQGMLDRARHTIGSAVTAPKGTHLDFVRKDVFEYTAESSDRRFDLILCFGLIAHTGRLTQLLSGLRPMLTCNGAILLQTTLLDHPGVRIVKALAGEQYFRRHGYRMSYFRQRDILEAASHSGLAVVACRRFKVGFPFGDSIWKLGNYWIEHMLQRFAMSHGAEAIYVLKQFPSNESSCPC
jgi:1,2-diacylglycerol 3-alpha-glucosyltransferase